MHPPGESMGSIFRVRNLCQGLSKLSHKSFIFTPFKYFDDWGPLVEFVSIPVISKGEGLNLSKFFYRFIRKILDLPIISNYTFLNPIIFNYMVDRISQKLLNVIKEESIHLDVIIGETEVGGLILNKIKDKINFPVIVDYQNFWPEELIEHKIIKRNSRRYNRLIDMEQKIIDQSDLVITPSIALKNYLLKYFLKNNKTKIKAIINGGIPALDKPIIKKLPPKIINAGMVVHRSNFKLFLKSIPFVLKKYPDIQIYVTRKGENLKKTIKLAKKLNLNINFYWRETYNEFLNLLSQCHVGVVTSSYELTRKLGFVTKIYDYFSVGIPVVGNDIGGWTSIIPQEKVGLLSSNDPEDLANKIIYFIENPDKANEYGKRGIELLKNKYSIIFSAQKLIKCIEMIQN